MSDTIIRRPYRVKEFSKTYRIPQGTVYHWIREGKINVARIGGTIFIPAEEVERLLTPTAAA